MLIVDRRGRAGQIVDLVDLDIERKRHVVADQLEAMVIERCVDIAPRAGEIVVDADDAGALFQQPLAQVRAEKSGAAGYQHAGFKMHVRSSL